MLGGALSGMRFDVRDDSEVSFLACQIFRCNSKFVRQPHTTNESTNNQHARTRFDLAVAISV
jgi:hypothetical protein